MAQIKKVKTSEGVQFYPQTHTKAVIDDNGYTAESRLQAMQDEINQAQLAVGAVPSDLTPTENSSNWVTSGGVFKAVEDSSYIISEHFNISDASVSASNSAKQTIEKTETGFVISSLVSGRTIYAYCTIPNLEIGKEYTISFDYSLNQESAASYPYLLNVFTDETRTTKLTSRRLQDFGLSGSLQMNITPTTDTTTFCMANNDMGAGCVATISNVSVIEREPVNKIALDLNEKVENVQENSYKIDYLTGTADATFDDITEIGRTDTSIIDVSLDNETKTIKFNAVGTKTNKKYAWISLPNGLINGVQYKITFDYESTTDGDGWFALSESVGTFVMGANLRGKGSGSIKFTMSNGLKYLYISSNSLYPAGAHIYVSNIQFLKYNGEEYSPVPTIEKKIDALYDNLDGATYKATYSGEKIPKIGKTYNIGYKKLMNNKACQAGSAYGNYYFQFTNTHSSMTIYDLTTNTEHSTISMTADSRDHVNTAQFSNIFYDSNDVFPLIYTSGSVQASYTRNSIKAWRIQLVNNVFSITQIQEIILPEGADGEWIWGQAYLDNELGHIWYSTNEVQKAVYYKFSIPSIFDTENEGAVIPEVTLTKEDVLDKFTTEKNVNQQGGCVSNGILYLLDGVPAWGTLTKLYVVDLRGKRLVNIIDLYHILGVTAEFEGCGIYNDTLIANTNGGGIYAIYF